jgi:hypothetical protein
VSSFHGDRDSTAASTIRDPGPGTLWPLIGAIVAGTFVCFVFAAISLWVGVPMIAVFGAVIAWLALDLETRESRDAESRVFEQGLAAGRAEGVPVLAERDMLRTELHAARLRARDAEKDRDETEAQTKLANEAAERAKQETAQVRREMKLTMDAARSVAERAGMQWNPPTAPTWPAPDPPPTP